MISGMLELFGDKALDDLVNAVFSVLGRTGLRIYSDEILDALAARGANVDRGRGVARFPARLLEDVIAEQRSRSWQPPRLVGPPPYQLRPRVGMLVAPFFYDYKRQGPRPATTEDLINGIRLGDVIGPAQQTVALPIQRRIDPPMAEAIEAYAIQLENTSRPSGPEPMDVVEMPYIMEINDIWWGDRMHFFPDGVMCATSPLTMGRMLCRFILLWARHGGKGIRHIAVMPISGGNAPVTAAGNIVISACEILGVWTASKALVAGAHVTGGVVGGTLDMRRGTSTFNSPEALLQDAGVCELFRKRFGGHVSFGGGSDYIEATAPGLAAAWEKVWASSVAASFAGHHFYLDANGGLDAGRCFSPEQLLIERDLLDGLWRFGEGIEVNAGTLATEVIDLVGPGEGRSYLDQEHTLRNHRRALWQPELLSRELWAQERALGAYEKRILDEAHERYLEALKKWQPPPVDEQKRKAVWQVVERAKRELRGVRYGD